MRLAFMGTPSFAVPALAALLEAGHDIAAVYTQPPRPAGRGQKDKPSPVQEFAEAQGLNVRAPQNFKQHQDQQAFSQLNLDVAVVVAYGLILPPAILAAPRYGCINIHASLLPRWRGAAPIHAALLAGDKETGITIMKMDEGLDTGPMLSQHKIAIAADETMGDLHDRLAKVGAEAIVSTLSTQSTGEMSRLQPMPQPHMGVAYARKITKNDARLVWSQPAETLARQVRAFAPAPGAFFEFRGERIKVLRAEVIAGAAPTAPGTILDENLGVSCGSDGLRLLELQRAGRQSLLAREFLRGFSLPPGTNLSISLSKTS